MHIYCLVRKDIPIADQLVQAGHACLESGFTFKKPDEHPNMVLLELKDSKDLLRAKEFLEYKGIRYVEFFEPDNNLGLTALCTEPMERNGKGLFKFWKLWSLE